MRECLSTSTISNNNNKDNEKKKTNNQKKWKTCFLIFILALNTHSLKFISFFTFCQSGFSFRSLGTGFFIFFIYIFVYSYVYDMSFRWCFYYTCTCMSCYIQILESEFFMSLLEYYERCVYMLKCYYIMKYYVYFQVC